MMHRTIRRWLSRRFAAVHLVLFEQLQFDGAEEQVVLLKLIGESALPGQVLVRIGEENSVEELRTTSVVTAAYGTLDRPLAGLGVVGPTRMDYPGTISAVRAVARYVGEVLAQGSGG